jgi:hypothetical protein
MFFAASDCSHCRSGVEIQNRIDGHFQHRTAFVPYRRGPHFLEAQILSQQLPRCKPQIRFALAGIHVCMRGPAIFRS